jgi:hypothetical protein
MTSTLTPILAIAKEILASAGLKGMHVDDIAGAAVNSNKNLGLSAEDFSKRLQAALPANLKLKTSKPSFVRVLGNKGQYKRGWYRVKQDKTGTVVAQVTPPDNADKNFVGKAGEFAVMSELLFWGYNASVMTVDSGIDVVASKDNKYFHIQVKTSVEKDGDGRFQFSIKNNSFISQNGSNMFYVFVLRRGLTNEFVIIPSSHLQILIAGGKISPGPTLSIQIQVDANRKKYVLNQSSAVDLFVGNFDGIIV